VADFFEGRDDACARNWAEHAQDPDAGQSPVFGPRLFAFVGDGVFGDEADPLHACWHVDAERRLGLLGAEQRHLALDVDFEFRFGVVAQRERARVAQAARRGRRLLPLALLKGVRRLPIAELERRAGGEIQRVLAAFGAEPEAIFAA